MYRVASRIRKALSDAPLTEVWFAFEDLQSWSGRLEGQPLGSVETLGKALLLKFPDGTTIYTHNQLYGRWVFSSPDRRPDTGRQLRLALGTQKKSALLYSASEIDVLAAGDLEKHAFIRRADREDHLQWSPAVLLPALPDRLSHVYFSAMNSSRAISISASNASP